MEGWGCGAGARSAARQCVRSSSAPLGQRRRCAAKVPTGLHRRHRAGWGAVAPATGSSARGRRGARREPHPPCSAPCPARSPRGCMHHCRTHDSRMRASGGADGPHAGAASCGAAPRVRAGRAARPPLVAHLAAPALAGTRLASIGDERVQGLGELAVDLHDWGGRPGAGHGVYETCDDTQRNYIAVRTGGDFHLSPPWDDRRVDTLFEALRFARPSGSLGVWRLQISL